MKREIKFRAFDTKNKRWLCGYETLGGFDIMGECIIFGEWASQLGPIDQWNDIAVMQYTGLKDKNGKEIYEGDIIRAYQSDGSQVLHSISYSNEESRFIVSCVGYRNLFGGFDQRWINEFGKEIIGNIHENPELLTP